MSLSNLSTAGLEKLITLVKKRESLQAEIANIEQQLSAALGETTSAPVAKAPGAKRGRRKGSTVKAAPAAKEAPKAAAAPSAKPARKGKRGALKESVLSALSAAGPAGLGVKDLSNQLGVKNQNLHVWFSTTGKTVKGLKKTKAGTWAYAG